MNLREAIALVLASPRFVGFVCNMKIAGDFGSAKVCILGDDEAIEIDVVEWDEGDIEVVFTRTAYRYVPPDEASCPQQPDLGF